MSSLYRHFPVVFTLLAGVGCRSPLGYGDRTVRYAASAPVIDGVLNDPIWNQARRLELAANSGPALPSDARTHAQVAWDQQNLYVAFSCDDRNIRSRGTARDLRLWDFADAEVVEIVVAVSPLDHGYYELNFDPSGAVLDVKVAWDGDEPAFDAGWNADVVAATSVRGTVNHASDHDAGWTIEIAIGWSSLNAGTLRAGDRIIMNLHRADNGRLLAWSPTGGPSFHVPAAFQEMQLRGSD